jgi:hypothetical protein
MQTILLIVIFQTIKSSRSFFKFISKINQINQLSLLESPKNCKGLIKKITLGKIKLRYLESFQIFIKQIIMKTFLG